MSYDTLIDELNDAHGRGIMAELFKEHSDPTMKYRRITRGMYRDQFGFGQNYAHVLVEWQEMKDTWEKLST